MSAYFAPVVDATAATSFEENGTLVFVDSTEYEFVSGGAAAVNNL